MTKLFFLGLSIASLCATAQNTITVTEVTKRMSIDTQPSFMVSIPQTTRKEVEKDWLKYLSAGSKGKTTVNNGENIQTGVVHKNISPKPFIVYSTVIETTDGVNLTGWFTENDKTFFSKNLNADQALAVQKYVRDFAVIEYQDAVKEELKMEQNKLIALNKQLDNNINATEKSGKRIDNNNRAIEKGTDKIATNNADIQSSSNKIVDQKAMVEQTSSDANANKGAKQTLREDERAKEKLQNHNENESKNIAAANKSTRAEERNTATLKENELSKEAQIEVQKQKVQAVQIKLSNIK